MFTTGDLVCLPNRSFGYLITHVASKGIVEFIKPYSGEIDSYHYSHLKLCPDKDCSEFRVGDKVEFIPDFYPVGPREYIRLGDKKHRTFYEVLKHKCVSGQGLVQAFSPNAQLTIKEILQGRAVVEISMPETPIALHQIFSLNNFRKKVVEKEKVESPFVDLASYGGFPVRYEHWKLGPEYEKLFANVGELPIIRDPFNRFNDLPLKDHVQPTNQTRYIQDKIAKMVTDTNFDYVRPFFTGAIKKRRNIFARKLEGIKNVIRRYFA